MQKYDLIVFNDQPHRILSLKDDCAIIINCDSLKMPYKINAESLVDCIKVDKLSKEFPEMTSLSAQKQKIAHQRYTIIAPILPFVDDEYMRSKLISQVSITANISKQTIRKYLCRYLAYQNISCLVPCKKDENKELSLDEKNFRWAINKYFYSPMKHTLKNSYLFMLKEKYTDPTGKLMNGYPPFHRFRYFYNKTKKLQNYYISREGLSSYQRNHRPLLGEGVREFAKTMELVHENISVSDVEETAPEDILELDAELIDDFIAGKDGAKKKAKKIEIDLVARILVHGKDPRFIKLGERLEELREKHEQGLITSIEFLKRLLELAKEAVQAEKEVVPVAEVDKGKAALTELFNGVRCNNTPVIVERIVKDIDDIVRIVRFDGWQTTVAGKREVKRALRSVVSVKYKIKDKELFDKAYGYIEQYY